MYRAAVIGLGRMGKRHVLVARSAGLEIVGVVDAKRDSLESAAKELGLPESVLFMEVEKMLHAVKPDVVVVATTAPSHCSLVKQAAQAGAKFIFCEKPMAVSLRECDEMMDACKAAGVVLGVNHQMRFMEQYTKPKSMLDSDALGGLGSVTVTAGNFGVAMNGCHYFEMFRYMTGENVEEVAAWLSKDPLPNPRGPEFEDRAGSVRLVTPSGRRLYMDACADQGHGVRVTYTGRNGQITVDELAGNMIWSERDAEHRAQPTTRYGMPWKDHQAKIAPADVLEPSKAVLMAMLEGRNYTSGEEGKQAVRILVAAHVSSEHGGIPVRLSSDELPYDRRFPWA